MAGGGGGSYCYTIQKSNHLHNVEHVVLQPILFILKSVNNSNFELSSKRISTKYLKFKSYFFLWPGCGGGWGVETKAVWQMFKCGTIQISNHLHTVEHVVQSKSEKKKTYFFVCWGRGGCVATALMAQVDKGGLTNWVRLKKNYVFAYFLYRCYI